MNCRSAFTFTLLGLLHGYHVNGHMSLDMEKQNLKETEWSHHISQKLAGRSESTTVFNAEAYGGGGQYCINGINHIPSG